jgi:hypothetical protein
MKRDGEMTTLNLLAMIPPLPKTCVLNARITGIYPS